jgi:hypothetical protein
MKQKDIFTLPKGKYYASLCPSGGSSSTYHAYLSLYNGDTWAAEYHDVGSGVACDLTNRTYTQVHVSIYIEAGTVCNNLVVKPMINAGTTALPYEPYYKGLRDNKATAIKNYGANLIPFPYVIGGAGATQTNGNITLTVNEDRSFTLKGTAKGTPSFVIAKNLDLPTDADYYLFANNIAGEWVGGINVYTVADGNYYNTSKANPTVKIPAGKKFTWISVSILNGSTVDATFKPMLSRVQAVPYQDYHEPITYPIPESLQGTGKGVEGASDTIDFENGKKTIKVATVTYDGTEKWNLNNSEAHGGFYNADALALPSVKNSFGLCSHYEVSRAQIPPLSSITISNPNLSGTRIWFRTYDATGANGFTSVAEWTDFLKEQAASGNPLTVTYALETPITEDIDPSAFDNLIEVEGGGSLEIITDNGKAVPSTVVYQTIV